MTEETKMTNLEEIAQWVAARALEIVLEKIDNADKPIVGEDDIQHVGYSTSIMGYDK